jgi:tRNA dimethylallyltransferase
VELACQFNGEIINCDAVQMYQGLPIITNKITVEEQKGIPHHLLGCIGLEEHTWTVGKFVPEALRIVKDIRSRGKIPILVGGTHYYIQSLLVQESLIEGDGEIYEESSGASFPILQETTEIILDKLREVDPTMANRWHPKDRRKIQRSLEIWLKTGKRASDIYIGQQQQSSSVTADDAEAITDAYVSQSSFFRFEPLIFWVYATKEALRPRLDARVLSMVKSGLLEEVDSLFRLQMRMDNDGKPVDHSRGIWVAIGYKEFAEYQLALQSEASPKTLEILEKVAIEKTQAATRQYANRQLRWIQIKFLNAMVRSGGLGQTFLLNGSNISNWKAQVTDSAIEVARKFLNDSPLPDPMRMAESLSSELIPKSRDLSQSRELWQKKTCDFCGVTATTEKDWNKHVQSNRHKKTVKHQTLGSTTEQNNIKDDTTLKAVTSTGG